MNHVFYPFLLQFILVLVEDILSYIETWQVLHLLSQHQLFLKQSKCAFGASEVESLGHIVGKDGV